MRERSIHNFPFRLQSSFGWCRATNQLPLAMLWVASVTILQPDNVGMVLGALELSGSIKR
jgi:hypothetical protein